MILVVDFKETNTNLDVDFYDNNAQFHADFGEITEIVSDSVPKYDGTYEVTPMTEMQTLRTAKKLMMDDITINEIPYYETSNLSGGNTVFIGKELN